MATYTGTGFPPWATISSSGLISISSSAPVGTATVSVTMLHNAVNYSKSIALIVTSPTVVNKYFTLGNQDKAIGKLKLSLSLEMFVSEAAKLQLPTGKLRVSLSTTQELIAAPPPDIAQENPTAKLRVSLALEQGYVPFNEGGC